MNKGFFVGECPFRKRGMQEILREKTLVNFLLNVTTTW